MADEKSDPTTDTGDEPRDSELEPEREPEIDERTAEDVDDDARSSAATSASAVPATSGTTSKSGSKASSKSAPQAKAKTKGRSGNPAKAGGAEKSSRFPRREKDELRVLDDPISTRQWRSPRFLLGMVLLLGGIAWMAYYYAVVRPEAGAEAGGPAFMGDLERWNYAIGFGAILLGLVVMAHRSTPLGRGRGVVVGMLGCFLVGLIWICTFYVITDDISRLPVFNDLGQFNLVVGIAFMAVGFTFATKWE